ncbi:MAG: AMIN domain-containing protein [Alphaproteobacteria bacterium]
MIWLRGLTVFFAVLGALVNAAYAKGAQDADASTVANDARLGGDLVRTRFVADLSEAVDFRAFILANPYRVIVDLPEVKFLMPSGVGAKGKGLVSAFRFGLFAPGKSRIVIDVVEPVQIDKAFVRAAENGTKRSYARRKTVSLRVLCLIWCAPLRKNLKNSFNSRQCSAQLRLEALNPAWSRSPRWGDKMEGAAEPRPQSISRLSCSILGMGVLIRERSVLAASTRKILCSPLLSC